MKGDRIHLSLDPWVKHEIEAIVSVAKGVREHDLRSAVVAKMKSLAETEVRGKIWRIYRDEWDTQKQFPEIIDELLGLAVPDGDESESDDDVEAAAV